MIAVIFEAWPAADQQKQYMDLAAALRPSLQELDGFISIERFESLTEPGKLLSLSFFRDEESVQRWRNLPQHRATQRRGRNGVFANYRLRVATVERDYGLRDRQQAPRDSLDVHGLVHANTITVPQTCKR
jgi:heme-degrading monooxygenase HmoA